MDLIQDFLHPSIVSVIGDKPDYLKPKPKMDKYRRIQKLTGTEGKEFKGHQKRVTCVRWNNEGRRLATSSVDPVVKVWQIDLTTGLVRKSIDLKGHTDSVQTICWDPWKADLLATASADRSVRLWDSRSASCIRQLPTSSQNRSVIWHPNGLSIAILMKDNSIATVDLRSFQMRSLAGQDDMGSDAGGVTEFHDIHWNLAGDLLLATTGNGELRIFDYSTMHHLDTLQSHTDLCHCVDVDPTGRFLVTGGADALACLWDTQDWICQRTFQQLDWPVQAVGFSCDGLIVACGSQDPFIDLSCVDTGESIAKVKTNGGCSSLHWHPRKAVLAYACEEQNNRTGQDEGNFRLFGL